MLKFKEFVSDILIFEKVDGKEVAIFPGRFQPFHNGHIEAIHRAAKQFGVPVIPIQIKSKNENSPFPDSLLEKIGKAMVKEFPFIEDYVLYPADKKTVIPQMVKLVQERGYDPIGVGCGSDRLRDYERQVEYLTSPKSDVPVNKFSVIMVDERRADGPSGTKVREALMNDDKEAFEKATPRSLHPFYKELQKYLK
jgi:cytidyltransferase-like protein